MAVLPKTIDKETLHTQKPTQWQSWQKQTYFPQNAKIYQEVSVVVIRTHAIGRNVFFKMAARNPYGTSMTARLIAYCRMAHDLSMLYTATAQQRRRMRHSKERGTGKRVDHTF